MKQLTKAYVFIALLCLAQVYASCDLPSLSNSPEGLTPSTGVSLRPSPGASPNTLSPSQGETEIPVINLGPSSSEHPLIRSNTCPEFGLLCEKPSTTSRQVSPPPERAHCFETSTAVHVHQDSDVTDESTSRSNSSAASCESKESDLEDLLTHIALAYEGYSVSKPEKFPPLFQMPSAYLSSMGYEKKPETLHYSVFEKHYTVFENEKNKTTTISFAGTNIRNMHVAMGSCLFWKPDQFDAVGRALLPSFFSSVVKKPFTTLMNAAIASSVLSTATTMFSWAKGWDILLPGLMASTSLVLSAIMWKNIASWIFLPVYLKHIHSMVQEIKPIYLDALKKGNKVSFAGHSLGGHFAQIFTAIFANTEAHCISAPGGGYCQLSILHGWYQSIYGEKDDLPGKNNLPSKEEWESHVHLYACDGDPIINVRHKNDATHNTLATHEEFGFQEGVDFHRIKNIYMMNYAEWFNEVIKKNRRK
ncbi:MAG: hypothetical protein NEHIOOID_01004 [Holosporales bacterium]